MKTAKISRTCHESITKKAKFAMLRRQNVMNLPCDQTTQQNMKHGNIKHLYNWHGRLYDPLPADLNCHGNYYVPTNGKT